MTRAKKPVTPERIMQFAWGYAPPLIIEAALRHRLFDLLHEAPLTLEQLATITGAAPRGLRAILNALVGLQLLARDRGGYMLTPESDAFLVSSKPEYRGPFFRHHCDQLLPRWMKLADVVRTGKPVRPTNKQKQGAQYFAAFVEALFPTNFPAATALGKYLGLSRRKQPVSVLDIGAGSGVWGIALAMQSPSVSICAVDWPEVLAVTRKVAARCNVAGRLTTVPGDYHTVDFGQDHQIATLGSILHSEGPKGIAGLLRKTFNALAPGGVVAIMEFLPQDDRTGPPQALLFAVNMLVNTEAGDTYTFTEISAWLRETGFTHPRLLDVPGGNPVILADKP